MTEHHHFSQHHNTPIANKNGTIITNAVKRIDQIEKQIAKMRQYMLMIKGKLIGIRNWLTKEHSRKKLR
jgi:hypothetical protein